MQKLGKRLGFAVATVVLLIAGIYLLRVGLGEVRTVWQLERIANANIQSILQGEVILTGMADKARQTLTPKLSEDGALYFRYLHEKETGSGDNRRWETVEDIRRAVDFTLTDGTDDVVISAQQGLSVIAWEISVASRESKGNHRYTEWALYPGQSLTVIGWMERLSRTAVVDFLHPGEYRPVVSRASPQTVIQDIGKSGLLWIFGGLAALCAALYCLTIVIQLHRLLVYLVALVLVLDMVLLYLGISQIQLDLKGVESRWQQQLTATESFIDEVATRNLYSYSTPWTHQQLEQLELVLDGSERSQLEAYLGHLHKTFDLSEDYLNRIPFRWFAAMNQVSLDWPEYLPQTRVSGAGSPEPGQSSTIAGTLPKKGIEPLYLIALAVACVVLFLASWYGLKLIRRKRCIENIATSAIAGMTWGLNEVTGVATLEDAASAPEGPLSRLPCVWYHYQEFERVSSGKNNSWKLRTDRQARVPFWLRDGSGEVLVNPDGADIISQHKKTVTQGSWRYVEKYITLGDSIYLLGDADVAKGRSAESSPAAKKESKSRVELEVRDSNRDEEIPYILSNLSERGVMQHIAESGLALLTLAVAASIAAGLFLQAFSGDFSPHHFLTTASVATGYLLVLTLIMHYNDLVFLQHRVQRNAANIEVALQRRFDLINNLVKTVSAYANHERELLQRIAEIRKNLQQSLQNANAGATWNQQESALAGNIRIVAERYPELHQQKIISKFMDTLEIQESYVSLMRTGYNDAVETYQSRIQSFPDVILAKLFGFKDVAFWK